MVGRGREKDGTQCGTVEGHGQGREGIGRLRPQDGVTLETDDGINVVKVLLKKMKVPKFVGDVRFVTT